MDDDALALGLAAVLGGQVVVAGGDPTVSEHGAGQLGQCRAQVGQRPARRTRARGPVVGGEQRRGGGGGGAGDARLWLGWTPASPSGRLRAGRRPGLTASPGAGPKSAGRTPATPR